MNYFTSDFFITEANACRKISASSFDSVSGGKSRSVFLLDEEPVKIL
jgi:hypothetical protein